MSDPHAIIKLIVIGKFTGFFIGMIGFFSLPILIPDTSLMFLSGFVLWYTTMGAVIGVFCYINWYPILGRPISWWFISAYIGIWMNFIQTLISFDKFKEISTIIFGTNSILSSPFWFILEGAIVGLIIGCFITHFAGKDKNLITSETK
ncbi:MAG: hypothetical protein HOM96_04105 [Rickettsiales bacterium]|nr:hypothetical protein [Rickettsiales bacterium]